MKDVVDLLLDLVAIPSVSSMSNQPVIDYAMASLDPDAWSFHCDHYLDPSGTPKTNLVALTKSAQGKHADLALVCHTDTVPYEANWTEAVHPTLRDGRLYGRGSCDVKSFLACALTALAKTDLSRSSLALVLTADEEVGCVGAKRLASQQAFSSRRMIIGEPTGMRPVRAGKGYGLASITVRGKEAHSAFPAAGRSAIYDAARVLLALEQLAGKLQDDADPGFDPPFTTLNVGVIEGGTAKNIVPGECRLTVEWRPIPRQDPSLVPQRIEQALIYLRETIGLDAVLEVKRSDPAFHPSATQALAELLSGMTNTQPATISFGSEAAHLRKLTGETVVFGPGDMTVAHKSGEYVPVSELRDCVRCLRACI